MRNSCIAHIASFSEYLLSQTYQVTELVFNCLRPKFAAGCIVAVLKLSTIYINWEGLPWVRNRKPRSPWICFCSTARGHMFCFKL